MSFSVYHGSPLMVDYTPTSNVSAGSVVTFAGKRCVVISDLVDTVKGALAWPNGTTVFTVDSSDEDFNAETYSVGSVVYPLDNGSYSLTDSDSNGSAFRVLAIDALDIPTIVVHGG